MECVGWHGHTTSLTTIGQWLDWCAHAGGGRDVLERLGTPGGPPPPPSDPPPLQTPPLLPFQGLGLTGHCTPINNENHKNFASAPSAICLGGPQEEGGGGSAGSRLVPPPTWPRANPPPSSPPPSPLPLGGLLSLGFTRQVQSSGGGAPNPPQPHLHLRARMGERTARDLGRVAPRRIPHRMEAQVLPSRRDTLGGAGGGKGLCLSVYSCM